MKHASYASPSNLDLGAHKNWVKRYNVNVFHFLREVFFLELDFLREVVSKVPDYSHGHGHGNDQSDVTIDDRIISKRRKPTGDEANDIDEEIKKTKVLEMGQAEPSGRGRGRVRGREHGQSERTTERELLKHEMKIKPTILLAPALKTVSGCPHCHHNNYHRKAPKRQM